MEEIATIRSVAGRSPGLDDSLTRPAIRVHALEKRYGDVRAVRGINLEVRKAEIFGLIGPDGAGKTSTFQIIAGVMEASSGAVEVFGRPALEARAQTVRYSRPIRRACGRCL